MRTVSINPQECFHARVPVCLKSGITMKTLFQIYFSLCSSFFPFFSQVRFRRSPFLFLRSVPFSVVQGPGKAGPSLALQRGLALYEGCRPVGGGGGQATVQDRDPGVCRPSRLCVARVTCSGHRAGHLSQAPEPKPVSHFSGCVCFEKVMCDLKRLCVTARAWWICFAPALHSPTQSPPMPSPYSQARLPRGRTPHQPLLPVRRPAPRPSGHAQHPAWPPGLRDRPHTGQCTLGTPSGSDWGRLS